MQSTTFRCHHIHATANYCGSPALRGEQFCYYHHPTRRPPRPAGRKPRPHGFHWKPLEDRPSIQRALAKVVSRAISGRLDYERARFLVNILQIINHHSDGDARPLAALIQRAQMALGIARSEPLAGLIKAIRPVRRPVKNVPSPASSPYESAT